MTPGPVDPNRPRCSLAARDAGEQLAGTASTVRAFLLLEEPGPWGVLALHDARLPDGLGAELGRHCAAAGVRPLLIRRDQPQPHTTHPGSSTGPPPNAAPAQRTLAAAYGSPEGGWLESATITDPRDALDLDLAALAAGTGGLLPRSHEPLFAVCTHGRHDVCCAERGRPVLRALAQAEPEATWAVSHIGGDRFAANLLVLGEGLYYGGLDDESVLDVARAHREGRLDLDHLRGRSCWPMPVQAAEVHLRGHLADDRRHSLTLTGWRRQPDGTVQVEFGHSGRSWQVAVRPEPGMPRALTCSSLRIETPIVWALSDVQAG